MKPATISAGVVAWVGAALSSLCCLLPLAVIALGLSSASTGFPWTATVLAARLPDHLLS